LKQANQLARKMIGNFGMGDQLEVFSNENVNDDGVQFFGSANKYSDRTLRNMDKESLNLVIEAYNESLRILTENRPLLSEFTELLLEKTTMGKKDVPSHLFLR
jgi:cell division protease FtsH